MMHLEDQAPLLRGCPDRGGERPAKGGAHALRSNVWGDARKARRVPRQIRTWSLRRKPRCASTHGVDSRRQSGGTSPSVEGLPRQGRGEARKGRGPRVAQQRVGRRAQSASCPAPDQDMVTAPQIPMCIHPWRGFTEASGGPSPSVEGLPRQGRGEAGKGGAHTLRSNVWGDAQSASRPAPDKEKGLPFGSPFSLSGGEGGIVGCIHAPAPSALRAPGPAYGCPVLLLQNRRTPSGVLIPPHQRCRSLQQPPASPERWPRKKPPSGRLFSLSGGEGGIRTPEAL